VPLRRLLLGAELGQVASPNAMQNLATLAFFIDYAKQLNNTAL
jgi:acetoacetyl-CoA synthetase